MLDIRKELVTTKKLLQMLYLMLLCHIKYNTSYKSRAYIKLIIVRTLINLH